MTTSRQIGLRAPHAHDYVIVPKALIHGFPYLSDAAKLAYILLLSLDYNDKREVWLRRERLAMLRGVPWQTSHWHLRELLHYGLVERIDRRGTTNVWQINPLPQIELLRAEHIKAWIRDGAGVNWPGSFQDSFREWLKLSHPGRLDDLAVLHKSDAQWREIRKARRAQDRR